MALTAQRKPSAHHQKTRGAHHRHSKHYLKTYAPYLPLLLLVLVGLAVNSLWNHSTQQAVLGASTSLQANQLLVDSNAERTTAHFAPLSLNSQLSQAAQAKAADIAARDYWSHDAPDGTTPWKFVADAGYSYVVAGENLASGFTESHEIVTSWMNSPLHRANILSPKYQDVGFGVVVDDNFQGRGPTTIVVAMYGEPNNNQMGIAMTVAEPPVDSTTSAPQTASATTTRPYRAVSRVQAIAGVPLWFVTILLILTAAAFTVLLYRHAKAWHRLLARGEQFVLHHKMFDIVVVSLVVIGVLLTRATGFIG